LKPADLRFLADENIHPEAVRYLRSIGRDVLSVGETGLIGAPDTEILRRALELGRIVLTHDSDFGALAVAAGEATLGHLPAARSHPS
jgi:predicted nuclease of predicted toxin-antitoxin system